MDYIQYVFVEKNHNLKLTQKLSAGQKGYHSANGVVPTGDISYALNNLELTVTPEQSHVKQITAKKFQLTETNNILG